MPLSWKGGVVGEAICNASMEILDDGDIVAPLELIPSLNPSKAKPSIWLCQIDKKSGEVRPWVLWPPDRSQPTGLTDPITRNHLFCVHDNHAIFVTEDGLLSVKLPVQTNH